MAKKPVKYYVVDAFTDSAFKGNPAAVCLLEEEKDNQWLQSVAAEFNISETCYLTPIHGTSVPRFGLRWFTPVAEVKLCGHATLAAAHTLFSSGLVDKNVIEFVTLSGVLTAKKISTINGTSAQNNGEAKDGFYIELDFPADPIAEFNSSDTSLISEALNGASITDIKRTAIEDNLLVVLASGKNVTEVQPQLDAIVKCPGMGIIVTGIAPPESGFDIYSRYFCPKFGINEDPVCGSAHCGLAPYWSKKLGKSDLKAYQVDAFTDSAFKGNPAAVCLLEQEKDNQWLQSVAAEFNMPMTAYLTPIHRTSVPRFGVRYFTPSSTEVKLCGHATLAAAHILFSSGLVDKNVIEFVTLSGLLTVKKIPSIDVTGAPNLQNGEAKDGFYIELDFPADPIAEFNSNDTSLISEALNGASIIDIKRTEIADDILVVVTSGQNVTEVQPQLDAIAKLPGSGVIVTGIAPPESGFDFYSRFFAPKYGINEDPVCGTAHCGLASYWSKKLGKCDLNAYQASARGGILNLHVDEQKQSVFFRGKAVIVMEGCVLV